jgi:hypothetical protein
VPGKNFLGSYFLYQTGKLVIYFEYKVMQIKPQTKLGRWSIYLNSFFLAVIATSIILVNGLGLLSYGDHWWDVTVLVFLASIAAFILGAIAVGKNKERSVLVYASVIIGLLAILFILLHSLFIND